MTKNVTELSLKEEEVTKLKNELAKMRHQVGELSIKLQQRRPGDGVDSGAGSDVQRLQEHNKEQAQLVMKLKREKEELALKMKREQDEQSRHVMSLKGRIRELEETLEVRIIRACSVCLCVFYIFRGISLNQAAYFHYFFV